MAELTKSRTNENLASLIDTLTSIKREVYSYLDQALELDQQISSSTQKSNPSAYDTVIVLYNKSLQLTEKALNYYNIHKEKLSTQDEAIRTLAKLNSIKNQTIDRLNVLKSSQSTLKASDIDLSFLNISDDVLGVDEIDENIILVDDLPKYSETTANNEIVSTDKGFVESTKACEIFRLDNCAQLFYIGTDGSVSTPSSFKNISIFSFDKESVKKTKEGKDISGFIKCGDWMYPLVHNENPGMKTSFNAYIFPNNDSELNKHLEIPSAECSFIGITLDRKSLMNEQVNFFEDILINFNSLVYQDTTSKSNDVKVPLVDENLIPSSVVINENDNSKQSESQVKPTWSADNIAEKISTGSDYIAKGVATSTEYAAKYMGLGGEKLKSSMVPNTAPTKVDPSVQTVAKGVRYGTHQAVRVSSYLVNKLGSLATYTAKAAAPHIRKGTTSLLSSTGAASNEKEASNTVDNICKVGGSSLKGLVMVYSSLEDAAMTLGKNFTEQTVTVVDHKYGSDAAKATENGLYSVGNVAMTVNNAKGMKTKNIAKTFGKATAKEAIIHEKDSKMKLTDSDSKNA